MSGGSLNHFKAMRERRQERLDANGKKFRKGREKYSTVDASFDFPTLKEATQLELQSNIKNRLIAEQKSRNIKVFALTLVCMVVLIAALKYV